MTAQYVFEHPLDTSKSLLSLLPTEPPTPSLAIGTASSLPPTPTTFTENPQFLGILQSVFHAYATHDPEVKRQAAVFASPGGFNLGGNNRDSAGAANHQGGMGGANRGGWIHVSDTRNPPDWGRIAWPEDIFGSVEVDGEGRFVDASGNYQTSGTYRVITREGMYVTLVLDLEIERPLTDSLQTRNNALSARETCAAPPSA